MHSDFTGDKWFLLMNTEQQWIVWMQREDSTAPLPGLFLRLWNYEIAVSSWRFVSFYIGWDCCSLISFSCLGTFHWDKVFYSLKGQHLIPYIFLRRKMQTSLLKDVSQVLTGGVCLPNIYVGISVPEQPWRVTVCLHFAVFLFPSGEHLAADQVPGICCTIWLMWWMPFSLPPCCLELKCGIVS